VIQYEFEKVSDPICWNKCACWDPDGDNVENTTSFRLIKLLTANDAMGGGKICGFFFFFFLYMMAAKNWRSVIITCYNGGESVICCDL
jgi:hypothetical protein